MTSIELKELERGISLPVRVQPAARHCGITGVHAGALKISVNVAPERGKATAAVIDLLADKLQTSRNNIELLSGASSRQKVFLIHGLTMQELQSALESLVTEVNPN